MDDVMGDVLLRNLTSAQDMGHNTLGLDSGKERRGPGAVDQAHSNEKQMGIVTGTNERAKPGAQIIKRIDSSENKPQAATGSGSSWTAKPSRVSCLVKYDTLVSLRRWS